MTQERIIRLMAGFFILLSLALGFDGSPIYVSRWFLAFTAFVGFNLLQSGFTGFCPPEKLLTRLGVRKGSGASCCNQAIARDMGSGRAWKNRCNRM